MKEAGNKSVTSMTLNGADGVNTISRLPTVEAKLHVEILTGSPHTVLHFRLIHPDRHRHAIKLTGTVGELWAQLQEHQQLGYGVYFVVNDGGNTDDEITRVRALFADADDKPLPETWHHEPHCLVIRDATHWHAYWAVDDLPVAEFEAAQKRIAAHYGTDPAVCNPSRVMRLAGTMHTKGVPRRVSLIDNGLSECGSYGPNNVVEGLTTASDNKLHEPSPVRGEPVSFAHWQELVDCLDPNCCRDHWRDAIAASRAANCPDDPDGSKRLDYLDAWSAKAPAKYRGRDDVEKVWNTMPPKEDGVAYGTLYHLARAAGYSDSPGQSMTEVFAGVDCPGDTIEWPIINPNTGKPTKHPLNTEKFLAHNRVSLFHDEFLGLTYYETSNTAGELGDTAMRDLHQTAIRQGLDIAKEPFVETVIHIAHKEKRHPVRSYLHRLKWDGVPRVDRWLHTYGGAADSAYTCAVGRLVLVAAVRRVMQPGSKFDHMLVLEGEQNRAKSLALRTLAGNDWFTDSVNLGDDPKIMIEQTRGKWIVEVAELQGMGNRDVEHIKAQLSRQTDRARLPYDRSTTEVPRQFIITGTMNPNEGAGYLKDTTGNRRFLPISVQRFDIPALERDRDKLWAEAVQLEKSYGILVLPEVLRDVAAQEQENRRQVDPLEARLREALEGLTGFIPTEEIYSLLGVGSDRVHLRTYRHEQLIPRVMKACGWDKGTRDKPVRRRIPSQDNPVRGYENDPYCPTILFADRSRFVPAPQEVCGTQAENF